MDVKRVLGFRNKDPYSVTIVFFARKRCSCSYTHSTLIYTVFGTQYFERNSKSKRDYWSVATVSKSEIFVETSISDDWFTSPMPGRFGCRRAGRNIRRVKIAFIGHKPAVFRCAYNRSFDIRSSTRVICT